MEHSLISFPNKFRAVICNVECRIVSVSVSICTGAELEPKSKSGISHLVERLIRAELLSEVSTVGAIVETKTDFEHIEITVSCQPEATEFVLKAISGCVFSFFPKQASLEREQFKISQEIEKESFNPMAQLFNLTQKYMYKGTNLSTTILGSERTIYSITLQDVREFLSSSIMPENILVSVVGDITLICKSTEKSLDYAMDLLKGYLNSYFYIKTIEQSGRRKIKSTPTVIPAEPIFIAKNKPLNQTRFQISFPTAPHESTGYKYSKILEKYLNLYLRIQLKETAGVYGVEIKVVQFKNNSHILISFAVDSEKAENIYEKVVSSLINFKSEQITKAEFDSLINMYKTEVALYHTMPSAMAIRYNKMLFLKDKLFDLDAELNQIAGLSYENFHTACSVTLDFNEMVVVALGRIDKEFDAFRLTRGR